MGLLVFQQSSGGTINVQGTNTASAFTWTIPASTDTFVGLAASQTLTSKTLTSPVISGGTIDNAVIGGTTAAAGSFTSVSASTSVTTPFVTSAASTNLLLKSAGTTAITIDTNQNVGVGVTPNAWSNFKAIQMTNGVGLASYTAGAVIMNLGANQYYNGSNYVYVNSDYSTSYQQTAGVHKWWIAPSGTAGATITETQAMTLDNSGNLLVATTSVINNGLISAAFNPSSKQGMTLQNSAGTNAVYIGFNNASNSQIGYISGNGSVVAYNITSDRRLKENITPLTDGLKNILALKPSKYNYISDTSNILDGFIADELQQIVPNAVTGQPNAIDKDGKPIYQGVDSSFLIPHIVSAIQELNATISTMQASLKAANIAGF